MFQQKNPQNITNLNKGKTEKQLTLFFCFLNFFAVAPSLCGWALGEKNI